MTDRRTVDVPTPSYGWEHPWPNAFEISRAFPSENWTLVGLGAALSVPERATRRALTDLADRVERWLPELDELPFDRGQLTKLRRVVQHRRSRLMK